MIEKIIEANHFRLENVRYIPEMQGKLWELSHPKSGARLCWLARDEENMTFAIGFRTIPTDSTGVFHILEHSVLGGSEKYPVKEPFVELLKSSLKTFLNAMTFPDKTVYPFSSRNRQDFLNLLGVYMDAVFHPLAVKTPNVFRQEGWRMELPEDGEPAFQGVVYNEMKGAFSDVRSVLMHTMMAQLFPDNCYRHESGGDPAHIPELTYEQFCSEHAKYYHPSNSLILLDGNVDLEACLHFLDSELCGYDRQEMTFPIAWQQPQPYREVRLPYEIGAEESPEHKTIVARGSLLCGYDDPETVLAAAILSEYLAGSNDSCLKKAILDAGLGSNFQLEINDGMQQAWLKWAVWNTDTEKLPEIQAVVRRTVEEQISNGLDAERMLGCYNALAFHQMDRDGSGFPRGLTEVITILESWLYGGDPAQNLAYSAVLDSLKAKLTTGYFEDLLRTMLLDDSNGVLLVLEPSQTLGQERVRSERERAAAYWGSLSDAEKAALRTELDTLHVWQHTPNSPEQLSSIPMLKLEDLTDEPQPLPVSKSQVDNVPVLTHKVSSDLTYQDLLFEASDADVEEMPLLHLLTIVLGSMPTANYTVSDLQTVLSQKIGKLQMETEIFHKTPDSHQIVFSVRTVGLPAYVTETADLLGEILTRTNFSDTALLKTILRQEQTSVQRKLIAAGNRYAVTRVGARQTSAGAAREYYSGCEYIRWLNENCDLDEMGLAALLNHLRRLAVNLFTRKRLTVSVSENAAQQAQALVSVLPAEGSNPQQQGSFPTMPACREGICIPAGVGFAAKGANLERLGWTYSGEMSVLSNLLSFQHLWEEIRVKGGAYGSGFLGGDSADVYCYSFRDPNPGHSLDSFNACADFTDAFCAANTDLTKFILGALNDTSPLLSPESKIRLAEMRCIKGTTMERVRQISHTLRTATPEALMQLGALLRTAFADDNYCIIAGREQLDACADRLDKITEVIA